MFKRWKKGKGLEAARVKRRAEDLLKGLAQGDRMEGGWRPEAELKGESGAMKEAVLRQLVEGGQAERTGVDWHLTAAGHQRAVELLRAHRVMETWLARQEGRAAEELHREADAAEHELSVERINELADAMKRPRFDPHGDPIPERARDLRRLDQKHLGEVQAGEAVRVVHIEDEPTEDYEQITAAGIALEVPLRVIRQGEADLEIELAGERQVLPAHLAEHIEVAELVAGEPEPEEIRRLTDLKAGESAEVAFISATCMGPERRRLLDFGLVPGSEVRCEFSSPFGSPVAYAVRGSILGLRRAQARNIFIRRAS